MALTNFCCCCDLRRGCIIFAWLQMMGITMIIATLIAYSDFFTVLAIQYSNASRFKDYYDYSTVYVFANIAASMKIAIGGLFIKGVTCIALTWGIAKECHLYYQPWLFFCGIEACIVTLSVIVFLFVGFIAEPLFFIAFFVNGVIAALTWYFWACVYTVYKRDMKPSAIAFEMQYDTIVESNLL